jgi:flagellar hook protein FlgE
MTFTIDFATGADLVQYGGQNTMEARFSDGGAIGSLVGYTIGDDGTVAGQFSNGKNATLARVATAVFASPGALLQKGDGNFIATIQTGRPLIGDPGSGSRGLLAAGTLEMSNVDLAKEFTNLIIAQRGFQANSRVITASDEMLSDLVNLKH